MLGQGQLYDLAADPYELKNLYGDPRHAPQQMRLLEQLLQWTIRTQDNLPTARYKAKWPERNWYAPYGRKRPRQARRLATIRWARAGSAAARLRVSPGSSRRLNNSTSSLS